MTTPKEYSSSTYEPQRVLRVTKSEATGNDFVMIFDPDDLIDLPPGAIARLCDRRKGIGADGVIRLVRHLGDAKESSDSSSHFRHSMRFFMDYRNADGSIAEMCGNGVRCAALYLLARGIVEGPQVPIETRAGHKIVVAENDSADFSVDMGQPGLAVDDIVDLTAPGIQLLKHATSMTPALVRVKLGTGQGVHSAGFCAGDSEEEFVDAYIVSMGNPHAVIFLHGDSSLDLESAVRHLGPLVERHSAFPNGTNVEFVSPSGKDTFRVRVWERGVGETLSCGTGACAVGVVALATGLATSDVVRLRFPGGELVVRLNKTVFLQGPAREVFEAEIDLERLLDE